MKKNTIILILCLICFIPNLLIAQKTKKLLIIGIDGCRADALLAAKANFIKSLLPTSTYTFDGKTCTPTMSCVGWSNIHTGVWPMKHNIMNTSNDFSPNNYKEWPDLFTYVKKTNPKYVTASFCTWSPLNINLLHTDHRVSLSDDALITSNAIDFITNNNPDAMFVHLDGVDEAGHANAFDPTNSTYITEIETADAYVKTIIQAVKNRSNYPNEDWLIILTTDHGGTSNYHGGKSILERTVWAILNGGNAIQNKQISNTSTATYSVAKSINFNGSSDYLKASNKSAFNFGTTQDFTIECKIKFNSITGEPVIIGNKDWNSGNNKGFVISFSGNTWKFNIGDGTNRQDILCTSIMDDKWHHIAVAVDRDKYIALYQDGEFMGALSANTIGDITSGIELALGQDGTTKYSNFFNGSIADVRIWNVALEPAVVKEWYNQPITASHPKYNMLNAYWKLDEGLGTTLKDSNGTNNLVYGGTNIQWNSLISSVTPTYANAMKSVDIAVTALDHMGIHVENLDGKSLLPENQNPPKTNFNSDVTTVVKCDYVSFSSISQNYPLSYAWSFQGGTPSTSTIVNPIVKYPIPGVYPVSLTVSNIYGNDTKTVNSYITVSDTPPSNVIEFDGFEDYIRLPQTTANNYFNTIF